MTWMLMGVHRPSLIGGGGGGSSPPSFVQAANTATNGASTTIAASLTGVAAGSCLVVGFAWYSSTGTTVSSVSGGGTFNAIGSEQAGTVDANDKIHAYYAMNVAGGNVTTTVTFSGNSEYRRIVIFELSGAATSSALDVNNAGNDATATPSITATGAAANTMGIGLIWNEGVAGNTYTAGSGWTEPTNGEAFDDYAMQMQYQQHAGGGNLTSSWTKANTGNSIMKIFTIKGA